MSIEYYAQTEENPDDRLVCPDCGSDVLTSEYGEVGLCPECFEEFPISQLHCRVPIFSVRETKKRTLSSKKTITEAE